MQISNQVKGKIYLIAAFILAGSSVVAAGYLVNALGPFSITFFSLLFGVATALIFYGKRTLCTIKRLSLRQWQILFLQALFGVFLFRVCLAFGLRHTSAAEAGIITGTTPAITALFAYFLLREKLSLKSVTGIAGAMLGILVLQGFPFNMQAFTLTHFLGNMLVVGSAACEASFTILARSLHISRKDAFKMHAAAQAGIVNIIALALCFLPMLLEWPWQSLAVLPLNGWLALVWYGSIVTVGAVVLMFSGTKYVDGYAIAALSGIIPLSALILSVVVLGDALYFYQALGCFLIVGSIFVMNIRFKHKN